MNIVTSKAVSTELLTNSALRHVLHLFRPVLLEESKLKVERVDGNGILPCMHLENPC
jgi:hypothetical protein